MDKIYLVASTLADIGKGWLTASIASLVGGHIIKIDPALNVLYGLDEIANFDCSLISTDAETYRKLGIEIEKEDVIDGGAVLYEFLNTARKHIRDFNIREGGRPTFADVSKLVAEKLEQRIENDVYRVPVIEMGGSVYDDNVGYLADGVRRFANDNEAELDLILLSYLTNSDDPNHKIKTTIAAEGIGKAVELYWREPRYVFVRDRATYGQMPAGEIEEALEKIADKTNMPRNRIIYEPEFKSVKLLRNYIQHLRLFHRELVFKVVAAKTP